MTVEIGRLAFTRRDGESFQVGEDTLVTIHRRGYERVARVEIIRADRTHQELRIRQGEPFSVHPQVEVELQFDHGRGASTKVKVTAPKNISIMRSELLSAPKKAASHRV
jgi:sRNA-binding carbon storage regulator CsrA